MKKRDNCIASLVPRYVSNSVLLKVYRFFAIFRVPWFIRKKNNRRNRILLARPEWNFLDEPGIYIENQNEWEEIWFGLGRHHSISYSGCEIIAAYNAWKALRGQTPHGHMAEMISYYEKYGAALWGMFGVMPTAITAYFRKNGFSVRETDGSDEAAAEEIGRTYRVMIATVYNDKSDITKQIHTVCITVNREGKYVLHNAYRRDERGRYRESVPYRSVQEAVGHISTRGPKLIYLIGVSG